MNQEEIKETMENLLCALGSEPGGKSKSIDEIVHRTGLNQNQVEDMISSLGEKWKVSKIHPRVE